MVYMKGILHYIQVLEGCPENNNLFIEVVHFISFEGKNCTVQNPSRTVKAHSVRV